MKWDSWRKDSEGNSLHSSCRGPKLCSQCPKRAAHMCSLTSTGTCAYLYIIIQRHTQICIIKNRNTNFLKSVWHGRSFKWEKVSGNHNPHGRRIKTPQKKPYTPKVRNRLKDRQSIRKATPPKMIVIKKEDVQQNIQRKCHEELTDGNTGHATACWLEWLKSGATLMWLPSFPSPFFFLINNPLSSIAQLVLPIRAYVWDPSLQWSNGKSNRDHFPKNVTFFHPAANSSSTRGGASWDPPSSKLELLSGSLLCR